VHPIERLRHVARAQGVPQRLVVAETARALASFSHDELGLVTACRRVVQRHPGCGSLVWVTASVLTAPDARAELRRTAGEVEDDRTGRHLVDALPDDATVLVVGWPEEAASALGRRGDLRVLVVDAFGEADDLVDLLEGAEVPAVSVAMEGLGAAVTAADVVVLEADGAGPDAFMAVAGSLASAATARAAGVPVWLSVPVGRTQPAAVWERFRDRVIDGCGTEPWVTGVDLVPWDLVDVVVRPTGVADLATMLARPDCPSAPELFAGDVM
jgi:hypothetical protein